MAASAAKAAPSIQPRLSRFVTNRYLTRTIQADASFIIEPKELPHEFNPPERVKARPPRPGASPRRTPPGPSGKPWPLRDLTTPDSHARLEGHPGPDLVRGVGQQHL